MKFHSNTVLSCIANILAIAFVAAVCPSNIASANPEATPPPPVDQPAATNQPSAPSTPLQVYEKAVAQIWTTYAKAIKPDLVKYEVAITPFESAHFKAVSEAREKRDNAQSAAYSKYLADGGKVLTFKAAEEAQAALKAEQDAANRVCGEQESAALKALLEEKCTIIQIGGAAFRPIRQANEKALKKAQDAYDALRTPDSQDLQVARKAAEDTYEREQQAADDIFNAEKLKIEQACDAAIAPAWLNCQTALRQVEIDLHKAQTAGGVSPAK